jgi:hypothetical protein
VIRYRYVTHFVPPAPFVNVTLRCLATDAKAGPLPGQVDTAADRTVLPEPVVVALGLQEDGKILIQGFGGAVVELPIYLVEFQVHDLPPLRLRAVLGKGEPHILVGRDALNAYRVLLDGPQTALEIDPPAAV